MAKIARNCMEDTPAAACAPWIDLPSDLTANILRRLCAVDILKNAQGVCSTWRRVCRDPAMWRDIDFGTFSFYFSYTPVHRIDRICRYAVDCSHGQLINLTFDKHCTDELLKYVYERSPNLKSLALCGCGKVSGKSLIATVENLPRLEELHLILGDVNSKISATHIETVGKSCPALRSFTYDGIRSSGTTDGNDYALAVAKSMRNLCHLQLIRLFMKNEVVLAVVENCPCLESLDLRLCTGTNLLQGIVGKIHLRHPGDSIDDYKWKDEELNHLGCDGCLDEDYYADDCCCCGGSDEVAVRDFDVDDYYFGL